MTTKREEKTMMAATKITPTTHQRLSRIADRLHVKPYTLVELMIDCIIRYGDEDQQLDPALRDALAVFEGFPKGWEQRARLMPATQPKVCKAIYIITEEGRKGGNLLATDGGLFGGSYNVQDSVQAVIEHGCPGLFRRLEEIRDDLGTRSLLETIRTLCDLHGEDPVEAHVRKEFADCRRSDYGRPIDQPKYVQHRNKNTYADEQRRNVSQPNLFDPLGDAGQAAED